MFLELLLAVFLLAIILIIDNFCRLVSAALCFPAVYYYILLFCPFIKKNFVAIHLKNIYAFFEKSINLFSSLRIFLFFKSFIEDNQEHSPRNKNLENEINLLVTKISRYYIKSWYSQISDNVEFTNYLNSTIKEIILCLCSRIVCADKRKFSFIVIQAYKHFFTHFLQLKEKPDCFKWENFKMKHWAMKDSSTEWYYLQSLVSEIMDIFGPYDCDRSLHSRSSPLIHKIIMEILTENLLIHLVNLLSNPASLNAIILQIISSCKENYSSLDTLNTSNLNQKLLNEVVSNPIVLLSEESCFTNPISEEHSNMQCEDSFIVSENESNNFNPKCSNLSSPGLKDKGFTDFTLSVYSGKKSSSNNSLFEKTHSLATEFDFSTCDKKIKRSRSADSICQMSHLKALSLKDYMITSRKENKIIISLKSAANLSSSIEQAEEAIEVEVPTLFSDVEITGTVQENENGIFPYTLYCIQYSALFHDTGKSQVPKFVKQVISIKRRFKEFLALQSVLENNLILKHYLKGIKGPSKSLQLPFSNLDKKNIAERKVFLESYLKELFNVVPISHSTALREFLGYSVFCGETEASFIKKPVDISVPRIDKMFVRGVKGAIDIFKIALPNSPLDGENPTLDKTQIEDAHLEHKFHEHFIDFSSRDPDIKQFIGQYFNNKSEFLSEDHVEDFDISYLKDFDFEVPLCCNYSVNCESSYLEEESSLGNCIFDLMLMATDFNPGSLISIFKLLCAPYIDRHFTDKINNLSENDISSYLSFIHNYLWPEQEENRLQLQFSESSEKKIIGLLDDYFSSKNFVHNFHALRKLRQNGISLLLSSIQNQEANKCLLYQIFDAVLEIL